MKIKIALFILALLAVLAFTPVGSQTANAIICRFEATACVESWGSNIIVYPGKPNATMTPSFKVVATSGAVSGKVYANTTPNVTCAKGQSTVTDTVTLTSSTTAIATPNWASCRPNVVTADANHCSAAVGTPGVVVVLVRNSAVTPAANSAGALVNWEVCGTGQ